jgi:Sporulation and spore germination/Immunoglobulin-like domain of bacterial spore germination
MIVRAYFLLDDRAGGDPTLVPVLRTVPKSAGKVRAAVTALFAGPSAKERSASMQITSLIPTGTELLSVKVSNGMATVDLSESFVSSHAMSVVRGRLAQVVFTVTQFSGIDVVWFLVEGRPIATRGQGWSDFDAPLTRVGFWDDLLPAIFVDRPAWGAGYPSGSHITGLANVLEAQFRIALRARDGTVLADQPVLAACGDGCWSDFDVTIRYQVKTAQWGTLRVWDTSEADGSTIDRRDYPVYLRP